MKDEAGLARSAEADEAAALPEQGEGLLGNGTERLPATGGVRVPLGGGFKVPAGLVAVLRARGDRSLEPPTTTA